MAARVRIALAALALLLCALPAFAGALEGRVVKVLDGDTIEVLAGGAAQRIRLSDIDTPERGQAFGTKATQAVRDLAGGENVLVEILDRDRYGRLIGRVFLPDGTILNRELVRLGLAWEYRQYSRDPALAAIEAEARAARRGLWTDPSPIPPWEWRKKK